MRRRPAETRSRPVTPLVPGTRPSPDGNLSHVTRTPRATGSVGAAPSADPPAAGDVEMLEASE
ncbi:hypothetical protein Acsp06_09590 [Actinomycetospora sp. NBRC 106375]|nr:hypothetical protein Acsp06_09590 [Actinomycetospora sp. NBRC 106375]